MLNFYLTQKLVDLRIQQVECRANELWKFHVVKAVPVDALTQASTRAAEVCCSV